MALEFKSTIIKPTDFFGKLFQIRDQIHLSHLATKSFAQHVALGEFYSNILELTDSLIESYQGKYGIINITIQSSTKVDPIVALKELAKLTDGGKAYIEFKETWIQNQLDEISALTYQTLYKLENLK
tara:strand:- start:6784 stop:7164 length:381 start_codon:yes stop_codon:yes gene_type:complete